jgi:thioredoxin reductase (NADPH)
VVGGGDSACEEAVYLTKYGSHVHLVVRSDKLRASAAMADRVLANDAITVHWNSEIDDVSGDDWMQSMTLRNRIEGGSSTLSVKGLFYAIGHTPNTDLLQGQLDLDEKGYLTTESGRPETSMEGVFAAGDVADAEWRQGITAAGSGCKAALAAERWLSHHNLATRVQREQVEPAVAERPVNVDVTTEATYDPQGLWQKGSFALRKLYHDSAKPLMVIYTSPSCGPCHVLKPQLQRLIQELDGSAQAVVIDIEADQEIAEQAGVNGTPTVQLFHNKAMVKQWRGVKQRSEFKAAIETCLQAAA